MNISIRYYSGAGNTKYAAKMMGQAITFGENCDVCFGCIHNCPTESIQIGNLTVNNVRYNRVVLY